MQKLIIFLLLVSLPFSKNVLPDIPCIAENEDSCINKEVDDSQAQCCWITPSIQGNSGGFCAPSIGPITDIINFQKMEKFDAISKEVIGFALYGKATILGSIMQTLDEAIKLLSQVNINLKCHNKKEIDIKLDVFNDADKEKFKDENHCLYLTYKSFKDPSLKLECKNGVLTDTIKNEGFSCGYYGFKIETAGETKEFQTCFLYNKDVFSKLNGVEEISNTINKVVNKVTNKAVSFAVDIYDGSGSKFLYDSTTASFVKVNKSNFIMISKIIFILSLLLF